MTYLLTYGMQVFPALLMEIQFQYIKKFKDCLALNWKYYGRSKRQWIYHLTRYKIKTKKNLILPVWRKVTVCFLDVFAVSL
jgi:hypothetical protein